MKMRQNVCRCGVSEEENDDSTCGCGCCGTDDLETLLEKYGEVEVTLESGKEYEMHNNDQVEFHGNMVHLEGSRDGEWVELIFSTSRVESVKIHKSI